jgi:hypothetical protein
VNGNDRLGGLRVQRRQPTEQAKERENQNPHDGSPSPGVSGTKFEHVSHF